MFPDNPPSGLPKYVSDKQNIHLKRL